MTHQLKVFYIAEIVCILEYLQKINVTHRDIKPQNILVTGSGHLKLADFATADIVECTLLSEQFKKSIVGKKMSGSFFNDSSFTGGNQNILNSN